MENEMIDRVARAILKDVWGLEEADLPSGTMDHVIAGDNGAGLDLRSVARAAIVAMREPTEAMAKAASRNAAQGHHEITNAGCECVWKDMIDAALTPAKAPQTAS